MNFLYFHIHHINMLYKYGCNQSLYNRVMTLCLTVSACVELIAIYLAIFSERVVIFCIYALFI